MSRSLPVPLHNICAEGVFVNDTIRPRYCGNYLFAICSGTGSKLTGVGQYRRISSCMLSNRAWDCLKTSLILFLSPVFFLFEENGIPSGMEITRQQLSGFAREKSVPKSQQPRFTTLLWAPTRSLITKNRSRGWRQSRLSRTPYSITHALSGCLIHSHPPPRS